MSTRTYPLMLLSELIEGQEADFFALLTKKEALTTRDGKPYLKVAFRDAGREVGFPIWEDSIHATDCREHWEVGEFYKLRARYCETSYGPQLEISKIRPVSGHDEADGFDPTMCIPQSRFDPEDMFDELVQIINQHVTDAPLKRLALEVLNDNREQFVVFPAARRNHHAYVSGLLEHLLSVTRTCVFLVEKYDDYYPDLDPPLRKDVAIAGAALHDIGKLREYDLKSQGAEYSAAGNLVGHILQGRDIIRESTAAADVDEETLLRLEHIVVSHQRLPEWGAPKPPMTPEALIVHYADDLDAKFQMMYLALRDDLTEGPMTSSRNLLRQQLFRGFGGE